jgi:monoamine oxidase
MHCSIRGGAGLIADAMVKALSKKAQYGARVTAMSLVGGATPTSVSVTVSGESAPRNYSHVISTLPFGCLRMVDTTQLNFDWDTQTAIRALHYDCSVKVAIKFSTRWWQDPSGLPKGPHFGGVSSTDRPSRVVVYPSYGMHQNKDATMIVSYTWAQDALRLGALAKGKGTEEEKLLLQLILKDLADMHEIDVGKLSEMMVDYNVHNWYADEYSVGM